MVKFCQLWSHCLQHLNENGRPNTTKNWCCMWGNMNGLFYQDVHDLSHSTVIDMTLTWRNFALHVQPDFDEAKGEWPDLPDLLIWGETCSSVDEYRHWVEEHATAFLLRGHVRGGEQVLPVNVTEGNELLTPGMWVFILAVKWHVNIVSAKHPLQLHAIKYTLIILHIFKGKYHCMADLLFYRFGFNQTSLSLDNLNITKHLNKNL